MKCYSLMLGARRSATAGRHFARADDAQVRAITQRHFPEGFTILHADGGWFDPATRRFVAEESRQILVCASSVRRLRRWCEELAQALRQKELLVVEVGRARTFSVRAGLRATPARKITKSRQPAR